VRNNVLGERDVQPTPAQLAQMRALVRQAMEEGALGVTTALIYSPNDYAKTPELMALASESARCGGLYSVHMRSEGDRLIEAVQETIDIAKASGAPAEIYHLKAAGKRNWNKLDALIHEVETARAAGIRITADMYVYTAGRRVLMPPCPLGAGRGPGSVDRAAQSPGGSHPRVGRDARSRARLGEPLWRGRCGRYAAARLQEPGAQAAHGQDAGGSGAAARREPRRRRDRPGGAGRFARRGGVLPHVGRERAPRGRATVGQFSIRMRMPPRPKAFS